MLLRKTQVCRGFKTMATSNSSIPILFFKRKLQHGLLCGLRRGIRCDWYRIACKENKNGTCSLTTCTPRFLFYIEEKERFIPRSPQAPDKALRPRRRGI